MDINKCKSCGTKFEYKDLLKPVGEMADPLICRNCGTAHKSTFISRLALSALMMLPVVFFVMLKIRINMALGFLLYVVYLTIIKALSPYILRYKLNDDNENKE